jgi:hypothetical protein
MNPTHTMIVRGIVTLVFVIFYGVIVMQVLDRQTEYAAGVKDVLLFLLGALTTSLVNVVGFWFNSSQGSAVASQALREIATKPNG